MSVHYYRHVQAWLDRSQSEALHGGGRLQDVCLLLSDGADAREPAGIAMLACQARELAFELLALLALAEQADRQRKPVCS